MDLTLCCIYRYTCNSHRVAVYIRDAPESKIIRHRTSEKNMTLDIRYPIEYPVEQLFGWIFSGYPIQIPQNFLLKKRKKSKGMINEEKSDN